VYHDGRGRGSRLVVRAEKDNQVPAGAWELFTAECC